MNGAELVAAFLRPPLPDADEEEIALREIIGSSIRRVLWRERLGRVAGALEELAAADAVWPEPVVVRVTVFGSKPIRAIAT